MPCEAAQKKHTKSTKKLKTDSRKTVQEYTQ